jgi:predicted transport protein
MGIRLINHDFQVIQKLNDIIKDSGDIGSFKIGNLEITINSLKEYQNELIST